ncbi:YeeE/YedE family protein [Marinoscillum sp.]|uniref:YeeE/YedE family protein n=1 Tax=Marinoscillum sp. TaxID=2024838 RepID=UPI003BA940D6
MNEIVAFVSQPWPWYVAGPIISLVMISLILFGNNFGLSSNLRTMCSIVGAGKNCEFFDFNWKNQLWNLVFAAGLVLGGLIAHTLLSSGTEVNLAASTVADLQSMGIEEPGTHLVPMDVFSWESLFTLRGFIILVGGGFLIGFGTRYAGGCTSGHAISGLSDLQLPSLIAVIGFFIGGLLVTYLVLPHLYTL